MEVRSSCPLVAAGFVWQWNATTYAQTVVVKATFRLTSGTSHLADAQEPINEGDVHADGDSRRSLMAPSDKVPHKPRADVMLVGHAYSPKNQPVRSLMARFVVGSLNRSLEVWCDRRFRLQDGQLREGPLFSKMPLCWERAAGGPETTNPVGIRFDGEPDAYGWLVFPNLQPPGTHVSQRSDSFAPVCFAPISATWPARSTKLGAFAATFSPTKWDTRPMPEGFDYAYFQAAPPDQQVTEIRPNERIILENLHPEHPHFVTNLPGIQPKVVVERATGERQNVKLVADTLRIDTDRAVCVVVWRATIWLQSATETGRILVTQDDSAIEELDESDLLNTVPPTESLTGDEPGSENETIAPWFDDSNAPVMPFSGRSAPQASVAVSPAAGSFDERSADEPSSENETVAPWFDDSNAPVMPFLGQDKPKAAPPPVPVVAPIPAIAAPPLPMPIVAPPPPPPAVPVPPPVVTPPPVLEPIAPASDDSRWAAKSAGPGEQPRLTFGQTAARAFGGATPAEPPPAKPSNPPKKQIKEFIEVLHVEADSMYRLKGHADWKKLLAEARPKLPSREPDEDIPAELRTLHRNLRDVTVIMTRAEALDEQGIRRAFSASVSDDGAFVAPVVLVEGDFRWSFDEVEALRVTAGLAGPLAATNKKVKELLDIATDMLDKPLVFKVSAANLTAKIREQFGVSSFAAQTEANAVIDQTLIERQAYQKRQFFNKKWLRGVLKVGGLSMTAYLPESALNMMPMSSELRIKAIAELKPPMTADDTGDSSLFLFAIARGLGSSSQWNR